MRFGRAARGRGGDALKLANVLCLISALSGCAVGPDFQPPEAKVQDNWIEAKDRRVKTAPVQKCWWRVFKDPVLDRLIERAAEQNLSVQIAGLRILEARAQLGVAVGSMYPQTQEGTGSAERVRLSTRVANRSYIARPEFWNFSLGFDASWELDFWGRFRRNVEAADAGLLATVADYDNALVSLTADVARAYTTMRTDEALIKIARENARVQEDGLKIAQSRFRNGATSELDVTQAQTLLESTLADIPDLQANLQRSKNALSILLGEPPGAIDALLRGPQIIPVASKRAAIGLPAELLRRRPDIRTAEMNAAAESARIGVAAADLYPRFYLFGEIGVQASDAAKLFAPGSLFFTAGPGFRWSILNYGRITNNVRMQDARLEQALVNYANTVIKAAQEVEDALISFLKAQESAGSLEKSSAAAKRSVDIAIIQYREGAENFQRVIDSQTRLLQQQNRLAQTRSAIATNLIAVYKALGGGWEVGEGRPVVAEAVQAHMASRTNWGDLLPAPPPAAPEAITPPPPASQTPILLPPDW